MEYAVLKLGGSLISPKDTPVDTAMVTAFVKELLQFYSSGEGKPRLVLVVGGGYLSRMYRDAADACGESSDVDRHRIGITTTWVNAELIRSLLDDVAFQRVLGVGVYAENQKEAEKLMANDFEAWLGSDVPVLVSGGFINGASTDFNAMLLASKIGVEKICKLTNVDYVYTSDPKENEEAEPVKDLSWDEMLRLFDASFENPEHRPGAHIPVDLLAAKLAKENGISCMLTDGRDPKILGELLEGQECEGTFIHP